jgi:hypothetical protein
VLADPAIGVESAPAIDGLFSIDRESAPPQGGARPSGDYRLSLGTELLARCSTAQEILSELGSALDFQVAAHARSFLFVHAGVVGWRGRVLVIPGRSCSGKSSLVTALIEAGAEYWSDEYALFDAQGQVHPYPRPLRLREPAGGVRRVTAEALGASVGTGPAPMGWVLSTSYVPGASFAPECRRPGRGLMELLGNCLVVRDRPHEVVDALALASRGATVFEGVRGEAPAAARWLLRTMNQAEPERGRKSVS